MLQLFCFAIYLPTSICQWLGGGIWSRCGYYQAKDLQNGGTRRIWVHLARRNTATSLQVYASLREWFHNLLFQIHNQVSIHTAPTYSFNATDDPAQILDFLRLINLLLKCCSHLLHKNIKIKVWNTVTTKLRVYENMGLRRVFRPMREDITGSWRILHVAELPCLSSSSNIIRVIKLKRWAWLDIRHLWERQEMHTTFYLNTWREDTGTDGKKILKWIFRKWGGRVWNGFIWLRLGTSGRLLYTW